MKKILRLSGMLMAALVLLFSARSTQASHYQGSDLTYGFVAPGVYQVVFKVYRDCSGATLNTSYDLAIQCANGGSSRTVTMLPTGGLVNGSPYCASSGKNTCTGAFDNYQTNTFSALVTFSAAEKACSNGMVRLSTQNNARPSNRNLQNASSMDLYSEATINLTPGINNNSVQFDANNIPIPFFCAENENILYSLNALDFDTTDVLTYKLRQPWGGLNQPIAYASATASSISNPGNTGTPPTNPPVGQVASIPTPASAYSVNWPIGSWKANDWTNATAGVTKFFQFDQSTGQMKFNTPKFQAGASTSGFNKYALAVEITEWRMINGVNTKVGTVVRDILMIVVDCQGNKPPTTTVAPPNPKVSAFVGDSVINVQTCNTSRIRIKFEDPNGDVLSVKLTNTFDPSITAFNIGGSNPTPGLLNNNTPTPIYVFDITPEPGDVNRNFFITANVEDNSCPIKGQASRTYRVHVIKQNLVEVDGAEARNLCFGDSDSLLITLNRPDTVLGQVVNYNYVWSIHPKTPNGDGLPANVNTEDILVNPSVTTRYLLSVTNGIQGCVDTVSVLVNVQGQPKFDRSKDSNGKEKSFFALKIKENTDGVKTPDLWNENEVNSLLNNNKYLHSGDSIRFGMRAMLIPNLLNTQVHKESFIYHWTAKTEKGTKYIQDDSASILTIMPFSTERYFLRVTNSTGVCVDTASILVKVSPFFLPNIITPNGDGKNDVFKVYSLPEGTTFQVFNRWGIMVKEFKDYKNDFNGEGVSDGTYYYYVKTPDNGPTYKGWFDIVRD